MTPTSEHVHKWEPDPIIGPEEERCAGCGLWRCHHRDRNRYVFERGQRVHPRCVEVSPSVHRYCERHQRLHSREWEAADAQATTE